MPPATDPSATDPDLAALLAAWGRSDFKDAIAAVAARRGAAPFLALADEIVARRRAPGVTAPRLFTSKEADVAAAGLLAAKAPIEPRWDEFLPFAWGTPELNAALADAIGPERTAASVLVAMRESGDVQGLRLGVAMLKVLGVRVAPPIVEAVVALLHKRGFGAQFPNARRELARLGQELDALAQRDGALGHLVQQARAARGKASKPAPKRP
ncbi:MAG: hypothetical protein JNJ54_04875 [Myxococcaceae bacterium]|nr:hypothetical protein [Myxococcaceae bacterium]